MNQFLNNLWAGLPNLLVAIILIIVALVVASLVRTLIKKGAHKLNLDTRLGSNKKTADSSIDMLGNLAYILILLLFLPGIFEKLGLTQISMPILGMLNNVLAFIPNLIGAAIILAIGYYLAKLIKELLAGFLRRVNIDRFQKRLGMKEDEDSVRISDALANIVYVLILIPIIIAALNTLRISVITEPAVAMLNSIFLMIPNIVAAIVILLIGIFLAKLVANLIYSLLEGSGLSDRVAEMVQSTAAYRLNLARIISEAVRWIIILGFLVEAFNVIQLDILNQVGTAILAYIPRVLAAALILLGAYLLGQLAKRFLTDTFDDGHTAGLVVNGIVLTVGVLAALSQLGIATNFLLPLFLITIAAFGLAAAIAFGLGGRDFAKNRLAKLEIALDEQEPQLKKASQKIKETEQQKKAEFDKNAAVARAEYHKESKARKAEADKAVLKDIKETDAKFDSIKDQFLNQKDDNPTL